MDIQEQTAIVVQIADPNPWYFWGAIVIPLILAGVTIWKVLKEKK